MARSYSLMLIRGLVLYLVSHNLLKNYLNQTVILLYMMKNFSVFKLYIVMLFFTFCLHLNMFLIWLNCLKIVMKMLYLAHRFICLIFQTLN